MSPAVAPDIDQAGVLAEALINAGKHLGLNQAERAKSSARTARPSAAAASIPPARPVNWPCCSSAAIARSTFWWAAIPNRCGTGCRPKTFIPAAPPLKHGSRFGTRSEPSLFYGSLETRTLLAEAAYYRFVFWHGMTRPPAGKLDTPAHPVWGGIPDSQRLQNPPFAAHRDALASPSDYRASQALGSRMRAAGIEAFEFLSARALEGGINLALFVPAAFAGNNPVSQEPWLCELTGDRVRFHAPRGRDMHEFPLGLFQLGVELQ